MYKHYTVFQVTLLKHTCICQLWYVWVVSCNQQTVVRTIQRASRMQHYTCTSVRVWLLICGRVFTSVTSCIYYKQLDVRVIKMQVRITEHIMCIRYGTHEYANKNDRRHTYQLLCMLYFRAHSLSSLWIAIAILLYKCNNWPSWYISG